MLCCNGHIKCHCRWCTWWSEGYDGWNDLRVIQLRVRPIKLLFKTRMQIRVL